MPQDLVQGDSNKQNKLDDFYHPYIDDDELDVDIGHLSDEDSALKVQFGESDRDDESFDGFDSSLSPEDANFSGRKPRSDASAVINLPFESEPDHLPGKLGGSGGSDSNYNKNHIDCARAQCKEVTFKLGQIFSSTDEFQEAVREYGIFHGFPIRFVRKDKNQCRARCKKECHWQIYCSKQGRKNTYCINTFVDVHNCVGRECRKQLADSKWLAKKIREVLKKFPMMNWKELHDHIYQVYGIDITKSKAYRVKKVAMESIEEKKNEQFARLWDYRQELLNTNPGSNVKIEASKLAPNLPPRFDRMYVCIDACRRGLLAGCRPLIGLGGCLLKGYYGGILLSAVAQDGNNGMFLVAYAIVGSESKDTWSWFLFRLIEDIGPMSEHGRWTFISDWRKGLSEALGDVYPSKYHRFCVRHLYHCFSKKWEDQRYKEILWSAAKATTLCDYEYQMERMKQLNEHAWRYLNDIGMERWSRAGFQCQIKSDLLVNNIGKSFHEKVNKLRGLGVISLIDNIRFSTMQRMTEYRDKMDKYDGSICPRIKKKLEKTKSESRGWTATCCGDMFKSEFEVYCGHEKYAVNLANHSCSCRAWDITGIPCKHAVTAILSKSLRCEDYVSKFFSREKFQFVYANFIHPVSGPQSWPITNNEHLLPPEFKRPVARPKAAKKLKLPYGPENPFKLKRNYGEVKCSKCNSYGHNKRTCKSLSDGELTATNQGQETCQVGTSKEASHETFYAEPIMSMKEPPLLSDSTNGSGDGHLGTALWDLD